MADQPCWGLSGSRNYPAMVEINFFRNATNRQQLQPGEVLFREGDEGHLMFAVIEGELELTCSGRVVDKVSTGGIVGEMALIDSEPRSATAIAKTAACVVPVDTRQFTFLVQEHPTFAVLVMKVMAERLRRTNATITRDTP
jgi:CRP/FNR family transcriptional regulator, cyclic AMP receptor protein